MMMPKLVVLTGAGMSAESGISTFRDANGLWENHKIEDVATPAAFERNPELVLNFYNLRRRQLFDVKPNAAHFLLAECERTFNTTIITQNVDDLHERAGSKDVLHLHGELRKVRSTKDPDLIFQHEHDLNLGDLCTLGSQLRPHIVWFGESVPMIETAIEVVMKADVIIVIGSSMQVYPAASLVGYASPVTPLFYIDPNPQLNHELFRNPNLTVIPEKATIGLPKALQQITSYFNTDQF